MKIVVAMSGGVDSSTVAGLLVEQGHEVIGLAMKTHDAAPKHNRACCTPDDMRDARRVADVLGIPFYVLNYAEVFRREIIAPFAEDYRQGRTPNPCVDCNEKVKFKPMLERAKLLGADVLATGHYARIHTHQGKPMLRRGADAHKDQSYFLYRLGPEQLRCLQFPLGHLTKDQVRQEAERLGLPVAKKTESQEICFVGADGYAAVVEAQGQTPPPGRIVDTSGKVLGAHQGVHHFTLGQRRGLGVSAPEPLYVTHIDPATATVTVGPKDALLTRTLDVQEVSWVDGPPGEGQPVWVQQRYRELPKPGRIEVRGPQAIRVYFDEPVPRGAPGQAAVVFDGELVLGGGRIARGAPSLRVLHEPGEASAFSGPPPLAEGGEVGQPSAPNLEPRV